MLWQTLKETVCKALHYSLPNSIQVHLMHLMGRMKWGIGWKRGKALQNQLGTSSLRERRGWRDVPQSSPLLLPAPDGPGIVAAAGVVNQADDKRILLSGYFTTPGLHHTTRFALRPASAVLLSLPAHF